MAAFCVQESDSLWVNFFFSKKTHKKCSKHGSQRTVVVISMKFIAIFSCVEIEMFDDKEREMNFLRRTNDR